MQLSSYYFCSDDHLFKDGIIDGKVLMYFMRTLPFIDNTIPFHQTQDVVGTLHDH